MKSQQSLKGASVGEDHFTPGELASGLLEFARKHGKAHFTPAELAERWRWHAESIRRAIREGRIETIVIPGSRNHLIPIEEVFRLESAGRRRTTAASISRDF